MTTDEYADRLAEVAAELVVRVRDEGPDDNAAWLATALPNPADRANLLYVLAAAVPDDRPWLHLTAWTTQPRRAPGPQPCGTPAAAKRHRDRGEPLDDACRVAERDDWRIRKRDQRARKRKTTTRLTRRTKETRAA